MRRDKVLRLALAAATLLAASAAREARAACENPSYYSCGDGSGCCPPGTICGTGANGCS